ncbi:DNA-binding protein [Flavobacterium akiainvivens]|uniref:DNA-binding protein n=1 Tax=Flavobacterium akiainvivens TaxID=1202724 RepID=A0A0M8MAK3_9FLAO|nr:helix-turn-helix domain-containing protein [Flavobacterium akiainvivens]KOS07073.1 DNA-binding protein [Flavobacterium akiainvivens]SFQ58504.1 Uncharacterized conserved protein, Tic20 family [Flavobacterium akiainvivens]
MTTVGKKIAEIRKQKGLTQEELSEAAKINLRTLQRIEKDETEPRGNSLQGICAALGVPVESILDYGKVEDPGYLVFLHLSVLGGVFIPFGNIILPLILWLNKRDRIKEVQLHGATILNFQIVWLVVINVLLVTYFLLKITKEAYANNYAYAAMAVYAINLIWPVVNAIRVKKNPEKQLYPVLIRFVK